MACSTMLFSNARLGTLQLLIAALDQAETSCDENMLIAVVILRIYEELEPRLHHVAQTEPGWLAVPCYSPMLVSGLRC
jgi:hypothetical protein